MWLRKTRTTAMEDKRAGASFSDGSKISFTAENLWDGPFRTAQEFDRKRSEMSSTKNDGKEMAIGTLARMRAALSSLQTVKPSSRTPQSPISQHGSKKEVLGTKSGGMNRIQTKDGSDHKIPNVRGAIRQRKPQQLLQSPWTSSQKSQKQAGEEELGLDKIIDFYLSNPHPDDQNSRLLRSNINESTRLTDEGNPLLGPIRRGRDWTISQFSSTEAYNLVKKQNHVRPMQEHDMSRDSGKAMTSNMLSDRNVRTRHDVARSQDQTLQPRQEDHSAATHVAPYGLESEAESTPSISALQHGIEEARDNAALYHTVEPEVNQEARALDEETSLPSMHNGPLGSSQLELIGRKPKTTVPEIVSEDDSGVKLIIFQFLHNRVEYAILCNIEAVNVDKLSQGFKCANCVYPNALVPKSQYEASQLRYETESNTIGWALAHLNFSLRGNQGILLGAVDAWRDAQLRSRRVRRMAKIQNERIVEDALPPDSVLTTTNARNSYAGEPEFNEDNNLLSSPSSVRGAVDHDGTKSGTPGSMTAVPKASSSTRVEFNGFGSAASAETDQPLSSSGNLERDGERSGSYDLVDEINKHPTDHYLSPASISAHNALISNDRVEGNSDGNDKEVTGLNSGITSLASLGKDKHLQTTVSGTLPSDAQDKAQRSDPCVENELTFVELLLAHGSYERRIVGCLVQGAPIQDGALLSSDATNALAMEVSWTPPNVVQCATHDTTPASNIVKCWIETKMGEKWHWWPLSARSYSLRTGYTRVSWRSPAGGHREVDLKTQAANALAFTLRTAPALLTLIAQDLKEEIVNRRATPLHPTWARPDQDRRGKTTGFKAPIQAERLSAYHLSERIMSRILTSPGVLATHLIGIWCGLLISLVIAVNVVHTLDLQSLDRFLLHYASPQSSMWSFFGVESETWLFPDTSKPSLLVYLFIWCLVAVPMELLVVVPVVKSLLWFFRNPDRSLAWARDLRLHLIAKSQTWIQQASSYITRAAQQTQGTNGGTALSGSTVTSPGGASYTMSTLSSSSASRPSATASSASTTSVPLPPMCDPRHLYVCIKTGSRYSFSALPVHTMQTDIDFFRALKSTYLRARPWYRRWFSMWRYDHCDFYQFHKYARNTGAPTQVDFPLASNNDYEFDPRPVEPLPPIGPITKDEFRDRFYLSCEHCHSWHQHQLQRLLFNQHDSDALKALPKRKLALEMGDGKREVFWGIYARERRSFFVVCVYASLCIVIPWLVFGFLWIFLWGHDGDLQNASVPIQVSLSAAMLYIALLYESREGKKGSK